MTLAPDDDPPTPTGNTATLLNDIAGHSKTAVNTVSDLIGAAADIAGAVGGVGAVVSLLQSVLSGVDETQALLVDILNTIQADFRQLNQDLGAGFILERNQALNDDISPAYTQLQTLPASLNAQPPLTASERIVDIGVCITALDQLNGLNPDIVWNMPFDWQTYFSDVGQQVALVYGLQDNSNGQPVITNVGVKDVGYGLLSPPRNPDGSTVFVYNYALPTHLLATTILLAVAGALDPDYATNYGVTLADVANTLQQKHDLICNTGIKVLAPARWSDTPTLLDDVNAGSQGLLGYGGEADGITWIYQGSAYFGAVEMFSGASKMVTTYGFDFSTQPASPIYDKILLRAIGCAKAVYEAVGLPAVLATIGRINQVLGQAPTAPQPRYNDWSIRRDVIPTLGAQPSGGAFSLRSMAQSIASTSPADGVAGQTLNLRALLTG